MQAEEYNRRGKEMVDYITKYLGSIRERRVIPDVKPGYMRQLLPEAAPTEPEDWENIFNDIEKVIMPGVVHWQSPHMHAYYPSLTSWPSMLGDMLADAINCVGFTWASSPACTELEMNVMDWLCKALELPSFFLHYHPDSRGGGILQSTVSESTLVALLAARKDKILQLRAELDQDVDGSVINSRLVAYASDQAHSSVEKAGLISLVKIRFLPTDDELSLRGDTLKQAIQEDRARGLVPFLLCSTLGTTGVCAFDKLSELGPHWQIPLSRRFRALKLWFVLRSFGLKNLQAHIRHVSDFEVPAKRHLGLVVFCLKVCNLSLYLNCAVNYKYVDLIAFTRKSLLTCAKKSLLHLVQWWFVIYLNVVS
uniref:Histidine decarboxylase n=1 Tax=Oreochromis aureus TaxID=47969 RepID=A0A668VED1_OREAU